MAKRSGYFGGRVGAAPSNGDLSTQRTANSKMWRHPATARQIAALKASGHFDGKYFSKGRAGQTIGKSVRANRGGDGR